MTTTPYVIGADRKSCVGGGWAGEGEARAGMHRAWKLCVGLGGVGGGQGEGGGRHLRAGGAAAAGSRPGHSCLRPRAARRTCPGLERVQLLLGLRHVGVEVGEGAQVPDAVVRVVVDGVKALVVLDRNLVGGVQ